MGQDGESKPIEDLEWFHGRMTRHVAEALLLTDGVEGSFLVRDTGEDDADPDSGSKMYCVSVRGKDEVKHFKLEFDGVMFSFGISEFDSFKHLMIHFANQPILCSNSGSMGYNFGLGTLVTLKYPYPNKVQEPDEFHEIRMHSTMSIDADVNVLQSRLKATPLASKAGFLTKQGGTVKTWKQRWFVCVKYQLRYFETRADEKPINTIDLSECSDCSVTEVQGRTFCFSLTFNDRIWIFSAENELDMNDWVALLRWKLDHQ